MKILLVVPRYNLTNKVDYSYSFPLGFGYISSALKQAGYEVDCLNLNHHNGLIKDIIHDTLDKKNYDFVCTGHTGIGYQVIKTIIDPVRSHESKPKVILGGPIITSEPYLMFDSLKPDFAVVGEGEITIVELLRCLESKSRKSSSRKNLKNLKKIDGIIYKDKNKTVMTKRRELIQDLDSLPLPDFEGLGFDKQLENMCTNDSFFHNAFDYPRTYPILCSRGCPFQCTFCYHCLGDQYRMRSLDNIMKEIEWAYKRYKINSLAFYDDLFAINRERLYEFCKKFKELTKKISADIKWACQLKVNTVDKEMLKILKDSGCVLVSYGLESMSPEVLKSMKKPITPEQIDKSIQMTKEAGLAFWGNFIFGDVAETKETAYKTLNYWKKNCDVQVGLDFIQPYPGSAIYHHCIKKGVIKDKLDFIKNIGTRYFVNMTDKMSDEEIKQLKKDILKALVRNRKSQVPTSIKKIGDDRYKIKVKCSYCDKIIEYKNFRADNRWYFSNLLICRNCNNRFRIMSSLKKLVFTFSPTIHSLLGFYVQMRRNILKKRI